jgi:aryl-alcohol dehydrogenase-like predicted oxidoreductase
LAWLFHKANELGVTVIPIPGTTKLDNVANNMGSVTINVKDEDSAVLEGLAERVVGERGNEWYVDKY